MQPALLFIEETEESLPLHHTRASPSEKPRATRYIEHPFNELPSNHTRASPSEKPRAPRFDEHLSNISEHTYQ